MTLEQKINSAIKDAMRARDKGRLRGLREIKSAILLVKTSENGSVLDEGGELKLLNKLYKQHQDSLEIFQKQGRDDLVAREAQDVATIKDFLPKRLTAEEIKPIIEAIIAETGASSMRDMGKVMRPVLQKLGGKADGKLVSTMVRTLLNS